MIWLSSDKADDVSLYLESWNWLPCIYTNKYIHKYMLKDINILNLKGNLEETGSLYGSVVFIDKEYLVLLKCLCLQSTLNIGSVCSEISIWLQWLLVDLAFIEPPLNVSNWDRIPQNVPYIWPLIHFEYFVMLSGQYVWPALKDNSDKVF